MTIITGNSLKLFKVLHKKMHKTTLCVLRLQWHITGVPFMRTYNSLCDHTQRTPSVTLLLFLYKIIVFFHIFLFCKRTLLLMVTKRSLLLMVFAEESWRFFHYRVGVLSTVCLTVRKPLLKNFLIKGHLIDWRINLELIIYGILGVSIISSYAIKKCKVYYPLCCLHPSTIVIMSFVPNLIGRW